MKPTTSRLATRSIGQTRQLARAFIALMATATLFAACSGGTPAASTGGGGGGASAQASSGTGGGAAGTADMCKLVSADEVGAATNDKVTTTEGDARSCTWTLSKLNAVNLRIESDDASDFKGQKILFADGRDISGLGDRAFWGPSLAVLYAVYHGKTYAVQLVLFANDDAKNLASATAILQKALSRI